MDTRSGEDTSSDTSSVLSIPNENLKISFDVIDTEIDTSSGSKYVLYVILVLDTTTVDLDETYVKRRYNDFKELHDNLKNQLPNVMQSVPFPRKRLFSHANSSAIEDRARKFEKYLRYIFVQEGVKHTNAFRKFFYEPHLIAATIDFKCESYESSCKEYQLAMNLQKKLNELPENLIPTMCGLIEVSQNLNKYKKVEELGTECLNLIQYDVTDAYLLPLLQRVIDSRKRLHLNSDWLKAKFKECKSNSPFDIESIQTLRELSVKRY